ncbi:MAG: ROK family protein, partial [Oscillospiraceae bacterium]|nr:ROK family protein [Oscillospiraceae bacterium]
VPELDPGFIPLAQFNRAFLAGADKPLDVAVERSKGQVAVWHVKIHSDPAFAAADEYYVERVIKTMLWMYGGFRVYLAGSGELAEKMKAHYSAQGRQAFDWDYMASVFEHPFEIVACDKVPEENSDPKAIGRHLEGCRIGFDAGGSDRKVSAVIDGEPVFSEEVVWFPKVTADPDYHYDGIVSALKAAAGHMPRVDAVGVSSAGVYIDNRTMNASLFLQVPRDLFDAKVKDIYIRAITDTFGDVPYIVANDGDVSALAGAMNLGENNVLGIAMGTSEAVGYVDAEGRVTGWLNELAFVPVDASPDAMRDEWSGDIGCGVKYFSQDAVIKLAPAAGIELDPALSPAEKLKAVQGLLSEGSEAAEKIYRSIGVYLGHSLALYHGYYGFKFAQLQGRVMSGRGGDIILDTAKAVLADEYPETAQAIDASLPDEKARRVGQSVAAASLPELKK